jgi:hypothetical protein
MNATQTQTELYYITKEAADVAEGPLTLDQIKQMCVSGEITEWAMHTPEGSENWQPISSIWKDARKEHAKRVDEERRKARSEQKGAQDQRNQAKEEEREIKRARPKGWGGVVSFGILLMILGVLLAFYYWLLCSTVVDSMHNIGLIADRQVGIVVAVGTGIAGLLFTMAGFALGYLEKMMWFAYLRHRNERQTFPPQNSGS